MTPESFHILVLCTGNSARSILGEALVSHYGGGAVKGLSAGSTPTGRVHPAALATLGAHGLPTQGYSSKSWDVFAAADAPAIDLAITVCDSAAGEPCPAFAGAPAVVHWGMPDPAAAPEAEQPAAFETVYQAFDTALHVLVPAVQSGMRGAALTALAKQLAPKDVAF